MKYWKVTKRSENSVIPVYKRDDSRDCIKYRGIPFIGLPGKVCGNDLEKHYHKIFETELKDAQMHSGTFVPTDTTNQIDASRQAFAKSCK